MIIDIPFEHTKEILEFVGACFGIFGAAVSFIWRFCLKPAKDFREAIMARFTAIEKDISAIKHSLENAHATIDDQEKHLSDTINKDIVHLKENVETLREDLNNHVTRLDAKNEKLLDIIVKFFTDKD